MIIKLTHCGAEFETERAKFRNGAHIPFQTALPSKLITIKVLDVVPV